MGSAIVLSSGGDVLFSICLRMHCKFVHFIQTVQDGRKMDHKQFRIELAKQLLANADHQIGPSRHLNAFPPARLTERHLPEKGQTCASGRPSQPVCVVCSNKGEARQRINASSVSYLCV